MSSVRANDLAIRLEQGAAALGTFASGLTDIEWGTRQPHDGRTIGVIVHHVATQYVLEMQVAQLVASGKAIEGITSENIDQINAKHAAEFSGATKAEALALLRRNSAAAASAIRALTDEQLDRAVPMSLYGDAPLTCQFFLEDHPVRHSYHHLALIKRAVLQPALTR
jgi:hypothetical protein